PSSATQPATHRRHEFNQDCAAASRGANLYSDTPVPNDTRDCNSPHARAPLQPAAHARPPTPTAQGRAAQSTAPRLLELLDQPLPYDCGHSHRGTPSENCN